MVPPNVVILSPGLSQSFAIASLLRQHFPDIGLFGYKLPGEKDGARRPFVRYIAPGEGEAAVEAGTAIMTGAAATQHALRDSRIRKFGSDPIREEKSVVLRQSRHVAVRAPA